MSMTLDRSETMQQPGVSLAGLQFAVLTSRNMVFMVAVIAMNYTLMRPSPVDILFILSLLITLFHMTISPKPELTRRAVFLILLLGAWGLSYITASLPHLGEQFVLFELIAKTFAISIGMIAAFVSMTWTTRHFETFMRVYVVSCCIASVLGAIGFVTQMELLTWDGRAKGLIDDPNMYGSFLIPASIFCTYFLFKRGSFKLYYVGAMGLVFLGILLSFSRIALVAAMLCILVYVLFHYRRNPVRLVTIIVGLPIVGMVMIGIASLVSPEFIVRFAERLTLAQPYDLGEQGRYARYVLVIPMILQNPIGVGVLQLEKIFPEPIHNIWLSSFVNYGWGGGVAYVTLAIGSVVVTVRNYRKTGNEIVVVLLAGLIGVIMCSSLHEGEHWRQSWLMYGLVWGLNAGKLMPARRTTRQAPSPAVAA